MSLLDQAASGGADDGPGTSREPRSRRALALAVLALVREHREPRENIQAVIIVRHRRILPRASFMR